MAFVWGSLLSLFGIAGAKAADGALKRLQEIHATVMDPNQTFSISATLAELDGLASAVEKTPANSAARGELAYLRGFVLYRAQRPEESVGPMVEASRIDAAAPFLTSGERWRNFYNIASQAKDLENWPLALEYYEKAISLLDADPQMTLDQRLGARQDWAYSLHEAGRFAEARKLNEYLLFEGEKLHGFDSYKLISVVINLAQNTYDLKDFTTARSYLDKYLRMATAEEDGARIDDALFQLGVLAYETGDSAEAESFMQRRLDLAKASGDPVRVLGAQDALDTLHDKIGK